MSSSSSTKQNLIDRLTEVFGEDFKTPLAKKLEVNVSTIRRIFNQREGIPLVYVKAIEKIIEEERQ